MRRPRRHCLPVLLLVTTAALGASAGTLKRRDSLDLLDLGWGGEDGYYRKSDGVYCQKCPAGTYIAEECKEENGSGRCEPCRHGEYMEYPNAFGWCQDCSECREDQVKQSPCQPVRNTVCVCKNGTFCPPDHPCEMCQKCQPRCPEGQVELKHCTPNSDLLCGPDTDTWPYYTKVVGTIITVIGVIAAGILVTFCCWKRPCSSPGDRRPSSRRPYEILSSMFGKLLFNKPVGSEDNTPVERSQPDTTAEEQEMLPNEKHTNEKPMRHLVPAPGNNPSPALRGTFYIFAEKIPMDYWMKFGHSLNLEDNDINMAKSDDGFYNMMRKWQNREGSKASVNMLLETLVRLNLGGVAEDISSILVKNGLFQYETS
ncbi:tumor necrosis factor receptor superfamily member 10A-like [Anomalospiza imberbis]|uniref:tumor necrosis factor receptor superfamily member 10A-like n=1 Tax=Anomalospiza imberbis TaxID=187417 RepID=UPI00358E85F4